MMYAVPLAVLWFCVGVYSHIYWWTKKHDYSTEDIFMSIIGGVVGPFNWLVGWMVCGDHEGRSRVLIRRRSPQATETPHE